MRYCENCGEALEDDALFCPVCGAKANIEESVPAAPKKAERKKRPGFIALIIICSMLVLLIVAGAVLYFTGAYLKLFPASPEKLSIIKQNQISELLDMLFEAQSRLMPIDVNADIELTGSAEVESTNPLEFAGLAGMYLDKLSADISLELSGNTGRASFEADFMSTELLTGYAALDEDGLSVTVPELEEKAYRLDLLKDEPGFGVISFLLSFEKLDEDRTRQEVLELTDMLEGLVTWDDITIVKGTEYGLFLGEKTVEADEYTITPDEEALRSTLNNLLARLKNGSYVGERLDWEYRKLTGRSLLDGLDTEKLAKRLFDGHFRLIIAAVDTEAVSTRLVTDSWELRFDSMENNGKKTYLMEFRDASGNEPEYYLALFTRDRSGGQDALSGVLVESPLESTEEGLASEKLRVSFTLDLSVRSALGTFKGDILVFRDGKETFSLNVLPEDGGIKHVFRWLDRVGNTAFSNVTLNAMVREGAGVSLPELGEEYGVATREELNAIIDDAKSKLLGLLLGKLFGGLF